MDHFIQRGSGLLAGLLIPLFLNVIPNASFAGVINKLIIKNDAGAARTETAKKEIKKKKSIQNEKPLSDFKKKKLKIEYQRALQTELLALGHQHSLELKELDLTLSKERRKWMLRLKPKKEDYFKKNKSVHKRRQYLFEEKKAIRNFDLSQKNERAERVIEQERRREKISSRQKNYFKKFNSFLTQGKRPPDELWPAAY